MLQIISGKFFNTDELSKSDGYNVLFSNYSWISEINTCITTLIPFYEKNHDFAYVVKYLNQIEKDPVLVRTGDEEIVQEFESLCIFGLRALFDSEKENIERFCRPSKGGMQSPRPSNYVPRYFDPHIHGRLEEIEQFSKIIRKVIGLPRKKFNSVISCTIAFSNSLKILDYNFDLSYSMLIYCLESLSQKGDNYQPIWEDYQKSEEMNGILYGIDPEIHLKIQKTILKDQHLKLQKRFTNFVLSNITDSFFIEESRDVKHPIRRSEIEKALINAYSMRSSFAHELKPILLHLKHPTIAEGDVYHHDNSPYFTYSGLIRLTHHVINNYISEQEYLESENFDYRSELPGILIMKMAPEYWIWRTEGFQKFEVSGRLSGFFSQYINSIYNQKPMTNCSDLMELYETMISQAEMRNRIPMVIHYCLYNLRLPEDKRTKLFAQLCKQREILDCLKICKIENLIFTILTGQEWPWNIDDCVSEYRRYQKKKYENSSLVLPQLLEILLLVKIANNFFSQAHYQQYYEWINFAFLESTGYPTLQNFFTSRFADGELIDFNSVLQLVLKTKT
ncbi:hypothetical protein [Methanoregula sp.]|uniref:hypothetical protein n=1 Tax=Methanoregula sp. TaxID=2052170 RepID=UPI0023704278|nr:hypothetical protein [Methanoregula sp.]MDD1686169.1 hypothetical protein [Methanoregula sp.]